MIIRYILLAILTLFGSYTDIFLFRMGVIPGSSPATTLMPIFLGLLFLAYPFNELIQNLKSKVLLFLLSIFLISILFSFNSTISSSVVQEVMQMQVMSIFLFFGAIQVFRSADDRMLRYFALGGLILLAGSVWYDLFIGLPRANIKIAQSVRKGGFGENPNASASGIKFLAVCTFLLLRKQKLWLNLMMVFAVTTTMLTLSRSGLIGIAVILIAGIMFNWQDKIEFNPIRQTLSVIRVILVFITLFMTITFLADIMRNEFPAFTRGTAGARLDLLTGNVHESNLEIRGNADMSRVTLMSGFFDAFVDKPWGHGNGYTRDQSINQLNTHNQILIYAVDYGIIGVLLFLILLMRMMLYGIQKLDLFYSIFAFLFFMECFFTHNLFFERSILVVLAFFEAKVFNAEVIQSNAAEKSTADDQD